ncbi:aldehyde dehydrogenase family protein [Sulfitobacter sp. M220]|jgi:succinate-semialdehyde dehydrogenase/glutarate-semialdehyde dehydrogenase|uniref:NAD-dependent succinate-semialdehyde dehydrogenase n=1 Tax=Sulfitobacter TaxID=60136 RepID=UPI001EEFBBED|nr:MULTISPECIES: NAD-dependent succinate-semialdehyde dehydrogenase [unclassified Sulfitobacter]MCF7726603.1 aldehyde dehydrogenase family protein [Sulfitobacter sp. M22]MCF7777945.1 aldehyde dehydrogenase family protein [Sulfitobacter sp. M220]|tara:strand:+ start:3851 stop:5239 length:1389 start_codon:yes stop_codon:yes gene_type:complete
MTGQITTINPATEQTLETYTLMTNDEARDAVRGCHDAFLDWRLKSTKDRAEIIRAIGKELSNSKEDFAQLMTREVGKLIGDSRDEIDLCVQICNFTADHGPDALADEERDIPGGTGVVHYAPLGVIYGIQPWNFPCYQVVRYAISNLMTGNGVLLKHAENCTGSGLFLRDLMERAGLPKNLFTVLLIDHDQSDLVIENDLVRGVTLTGSDTAGRTVAQKAAEQLKKSVLELGSNDAYIVLDDADIDLAVDTCVTARIYNNGQTCVNGKRFIVTAKNYDAFVEGYTQKMKAIKMGDPTDADIGLGPMARNDLRDKLAEQVAESIKKGARAVVGGETPDRKGAYYPATVLVDVKPGQPAYGDELFGPVASVIRAENDEDAMRIANDSRYGLGGGIFSRDEARARKLASEQFDTGMITLNGYNIALPNMPFGGVKNSGYGREHGGFGMKEFVNAKSIYMTDQEAK